MKLLRRGDRVKKDTFYMLFEVYDRGVNRKPHGDVIYILKITDVHSKHSITYELVAKFASTNRYGIETEYLNPRTVRREGFNPQHLCSRYTSFEMTEDEVMQNVLIPTL